MLRVAKEDLGRSGISPDEAEYAELYSAKSAADVFPEFDDVPALIIPYIDPWTDDYMEFERDGKMEPFCRVRYYHPVDKVQSFKKKKAIRYTQPKNSGVHAFFPIVEDIDWVEIAKDPDIPVMITEGEKKSLAACLAGVPTIGLGGVYNFAHDGELLPILDNIIWENRTVYICYDSDAADNNKIQVAEGRLATELSMKRNASVFLVRIPEKKGGGKVGVDDLIVAEGDDALFELLEKAPEMRKLDKEVLRLNADAAWIEKEGLVLDHSRDIWIKKSDFVKGSEYSTRTVVVPKERGDGVKIISVADLWLTHPHARRYADTIFDPGTEDKAIPLPKGGVAFNRFRGLDPEPCIEEEVEPFFDLYDYMMSRTDEFDHDLLWKTIAYKMQNLKAKLGLGLVLLGKQGGGKTLFSEIIAEMVTPYDTVIASSELGSDFNGWVETSLVCVMNEAKGAQLRYHMDTLKRYVTDNKLPLNEKYRARREVFTHFLLIFNSNERSAGALPDDDRRMVVISCPDTHPKGDEFYGPIYEWRQNGGAKKLLHYFLNYDLEGWVPPRHAPQTREKRMAYFASLTPIQKLGHAIKDASENLVAQWISAALDWAASDNIGPSQAQLASDIQHGMVHMHIRPFYTPEELALLFPHITANLNMGKVKAATPENVLAQELIQQGVEYLKCSDNFDGFMWKGQIRQFLIISDLHEYDRPITQKEFNKLMKSWPTYKEWRREKRQKHRERKQED